MTTEQQNITRVFLSFAAVLHEIQTRNIDDATQLDDSLICCTPVEITQSEHMYKYNLAYEALIRARTAGRLFCPAKNTALTDAEVNVFLQSHDIGQLTGSGDGSFDQIPLQRSVPDICGRSDIRVIWSPCPLPQRHASYEIRAEEPVGASKQSLQYTDAIDLDDGDWDGVDGNVSLADDTSDTCEDDDENGSEYGDDPDAWKRR